MLRFRRLSTTSEIIRGNLSDPLTSSAGTQSSCWYIPKEDRDESKRTYCLQGVNLSNLSHCLGGCMSEGSSLFLRSISRPREYRTKQFGWEPFQVERQPSGMFSQKNSHYSRAYSRTSRRKGRPPQHKERDKIAEAFEKMLMSSRHQLGYNPKLTWDDCKMLALQDLDGITPHRICVILNCCKQGKYIDAALLEILLRNTLANEEAMANFRPFSISMVIQSMGMMFRRAKETYKSQAIHFFEREGRQFVEALLEKCVREELFTRRDYGVKELSMLIHGLGLLFDTSDLEDAVPVVEQSMDITGPEFVRKGRVVPIFPHNFLNMAHGWSNLDYRDDEVIDRFCDLLRRELEMRREFFRGDEITHIGFALQRLGVSRAFLNEHRG
ncbi:hypothetical protein BSKO_11767 [Bryopsis sp. KO-2023]|nr:hypothetical protein BSKO_11767 [Bryopsis sp. KO-2023]